MPAYMDEKKKKILGNTAIQTPNMAAVCRRLFYEQTGKKNFSVIGRILITII